MVIQDALTTAAASLAALNACQILPLELQVAGSGVFNAAPALAPAEQLSNLLYPQSLEIPPAQSVFTVASGYTEPHPWVFWAVARSSMALAKPAYWMAGTSSQLEGDNNITFNLPESTDYLIPLDHNWNGFDFLRITQVPDPMTYTLYVYASTDWVGNRRDPSYALGSSCLDAQGRWLHQVAVTPGKYHVALLDSTEAVVAFPYIDAEPLA